MTTEQRQHQDWTQSRTGAIVFLSRRKGEQSQDSLSMGHVIAPVIVQTRKCPPHWPTWTTTHEEQVGNKPHAVWLFNAVRYGQTH